MSIETPEQFELTSLKQLLASAETPNKNSSKCIFLFFILGLLFLFLGFIVFKYELLSPYWAGLFCMLSGVCLAGAAIINRFKYESNIYIKYIDTNAIKNRISELEM